MGAIGKIREHSAISIKCFSEFCVRRIIVQAFEYAINNKRKVVTSVAKANIMRAPKPIPKYFNISF